MTDRMLKLIIGSLLHDIGKVVYRGGDGRNHSRSGYDFLKSETHVNDPEILDCVRFHHGTHLKDADIPQDSLAYITYYADNIAAASDRRENGNEEYGFDQYVPLDSVFNILNGNNEHRHYDRRVLNVKAGINYPTDKECIMDESFYRSVFDNIRDNLKGIEINDSYVNSLLTVLEANLSYVPSSTLKKEMCDISLYDHLKITAAVSACLLQYAEANDLTDFRKYFLNEGKEHYTDKMFLLYSMDISGIQDFIYTISSKGALRGLRSRSFYLEILMEHIIDEMLQKLELSRANLIYSGGGHCYMLLPNTKGCLEKLGQYELEVNDWFMDNFDNALYIAGGYAACSAKDLENEPKGSYSDLYIEISKDISAKKTHRYNADQIIKLNSRKHTGERECSICHRVDKLDEKDHCKICSVLEKMSDGILYNDFFTVFAGYREGALPLPCDRCVIADTDDALKCHMKEAEYVRAYSKNDLYTGEHVTTKLWVGSYTTGDTFEEFAAKSKNINKIGVLRADVDNLGKAFVSGFNGAGGDNRYVTLSRTAAFSRQMSLFFKCYINTIFNEGSSNIFSDDKKRNVTIVYSGGDDLFLVGAWNEVIDSFIDIRNAFSNFAQGTLSVSGGIGIYDSGYPINIMAKETGELEDMSKGLDGKDGITLFDESGTYKWDTFLNKVIGEKYRSLDNFFGASTERGSAFLYNLLGLLRESKDKIMTARYVYMLSRLEPEEDKSEDEKIAYRKFSRQMYDWMKNEEDKKQIITAIYLYVYMNRKSGVEE